MTGGAIPRKFVQRAARRVESNCPNSEGRQGATTLVDAHTGEDYHVAVSVDPLVSQFAKVALVPQHVARNARWPLIVLNFCPCAGACRR
eukprot:364899-Chlamydomonas_euryale.AAC.20